MWRHGVSIDAFAAGGVFLVGGLHICIVIDRLLPLDRGMSALFSRLHLFFYNPVMSIINGQKREQSISVGLSSTNGRPEPTPSTIANSGRENKRCEIYRYVSAKPLYAAAWSQKTDSKFRLAVGTLVEREQGNKVSVIQLNDETGELVEIACFGHEFPANAVGFIPDPENRYPDLIATTGDCLRIWKINGNTIDSDVALLANKATQYCAPLTNFDWNEADPRLIGTSSIDTTCTIYDVETGTNVGTTSFNVKTQLIAHDKPVHDIAFSKINSGKDHFATVGADGSARMFDLRHLEHSTIVYEDPQKTPLMRLAWNKQEPCYMATFSQDSNEVAILDIRMPCNPISKLKNHTAAVNGIAWAPHSPHHICTASDDKQALIWDVTHIPRPVDDPILAYTAEGEVNQVHWGPVHSNWICICFEKCMEILRAGYFERVRLSTEVRFPPGGQPHAVVPPLTAAILTPRMMELRKERFPMVPGYGGAMIFPNSQASQMPPQFHMPQPMEGPSTSALSQMSTQPVPADSYENMEACSAGPSEVNMGTATREEDKRKDIYGYNAPYTLYSTGWSAATDPQRKFRLAVSSFIEEYSNKVSVVQLDEEAGELVLRSTFDHPYPATKIMWIPDSKGTYPDLLATSGDYLRLWRIGVDNNAKIESLLNTNRTAEYCAPLTSFDWNELDLNLIGTSSIDTTCTVWQLETGQSIGSTRSMVDGNVRTQLIAHDKEVFDISFSRGNSQVFASVGADGSLRLFDLRRLEHSTIINEVIILDLRLPCTPVARLKNHTAPVNGISWAPHSSSHICSGGDDFQALIWDVHEMPKPIDDPILAYEANGEVNQIHWSNSFPDWISICYGNKLEILRV
ncbi:unnamed protein product [Caenorhabditis auriculariae]|uniref:Uncharacterized protein n=1 Tax=Caenorhabditis auriculariae TaxID=2777116 RepID=A0A8S1HAH7_9PELO|nr:unnamed protein product [Caenorhabditis auriculariae]